MFGKSGTDNDLPPRVSKAKGAPPDADSTVGRNARFEGDIKVEGSIRVEGILKGNIEAKERVDIGTKGVVEGGVTAREVTISGELIGNVLTAEITRLVAGARLRGSVETRRLIVDEGAIFAGRCIMDKAMNIVRSEGQAVGSGSDATLGTASPRTKR